VALAFALTGCGGVLSTLGAPDDAAATGQATADDRPSDEPIPKIDNPTLADLMAPGPLPERMLGKPDAPVTLIFYSSLTCPFCRAFEEKGLPEIKRLYIDKGQVRLVLREFPIGKTAGVAAIANRCIKESRYFALHRRFLVEQASWVSQEVRRDAIFEVAKKEGLTRAEFDNCLQNQAMIDGLKWVKERGRRLGVVGTPGFFVDETRLRTNPSLDDMKRAIEVALARRGATAKAQ
jgi:protein-disulfide isomerase